MIMCSYVLDPSTFCYQNMSPIREEDEHEAQEETPVQIEDTSADHMTSIKPTSSKRSFRMNEKLLEPYRKKPKMTSFNYRTKQMIEPPHWPLVIFRDLFWMMNLATSPEVPMWEGWNALITPDPLPKQTIG